MRAEEEVDQLFEFEDMSDGRVFDISEDEVSDRIVRFLGPVAEFFDGSFGLYRGEFLRPPLAEPL